MIKTVKIINFKGRVDENSFVRYTKCIFDLSASINANTSSGDAATFGMMGSTSANTDFRYYSRSSSLHPHYDRNFSLKKPILPWLDCIARHQFRVSF